MDTLSYFVLCIYLHVCTHTYSSSFWKNANFQYTFKKKMISCTHIYTFWARPSDTTTTRLTAGGMVCYRADDFLCLIVKLLRIIWWDLITLITIYKLLFVQKNINVNEVYVTRVYIFPYFLDKGTLRIHGRGWSRWFQNTPLPC